jgi:hypothetical protein
MLFKAQIAVLMIHLGDIGSVAAVIIAAALAAYIAYKWWERARFYQSLRMARINVAELYDLMQAGAMPIIVDVRSSTNRAGYPVRFMCHWTRWPNTCGTCRVIGRSFCIAHVRARLPPRASPAY